jgi:hypothetical protein
LLHRLGGGFKENGNIEYKQYNSDEELFDEVDRLMPLAVGVQT